MAKSLSYFMRDTAKGPETVEIPGVDSIRDEAGNVVPFTVRILGQDRIAECYEKHKKRSMVFDKRGNPYVKGNEAVFKTETDTAKAIRHILVDALEYPNLRDKELMDYYKCVDVTEMPLKVFPNPIEYQQVERNVLTALGILDGELTPDEEEAKN